MEKKITRPQNAPNPANNFLQEDFFSKIRGHLVHVYLNNNQDFWATVVGVDVYTVLFAVKDGNGKIIENFLIWKSALAGIKVNTGEVDFQTIRPKNKRIVSPRSYGSDQDLTKTSEKVTDAPQETQPTIHEPKQEKIEIKEANIEQEKTAPKEAVVVIPTTEQEASEGKEPEVKEPKEKEQRKRLKLLKLLKKQKKQKKQKNLSLLSMMLLK